MDYETVGEDGDAVLEDSTFVAQIKATEAVELARAYRRVGRRNGLDADMVKYYHMIGQEVEAEFLSLMDRWYEARQV